MHKFTTALRDLAARVAGYVLHKEPVLTGGVLAGVVLAVLAWFGWVPNTEAHEWIVTVCNLAAPIVTALLARMKAWSPQTHHEVMVAAVDRPSDTRSIG
jgi:hypothetical protein